MKSYQEIIKDHPSVYSFFQQVGVNQEPIRIQSRWRPDLNDIFLLHSPQGKMVLKHFSNDGPIEIAYHKEVARAYPGFVPEILVSEGSSLVMDYIDGVDLIQLFDRPAAEISGLLQGAGKALHALFESAASRSQSTGLGQLPYTLKYQKGRSSVEADRLQDALKLWQDPLSSYQGQTIHNDLNSLNFRLSDQGGIRALDPRVDKTRLQDVSKDIGRALASIMAAAYSNTCSPTNRYGNEEAAVLARAFSIPWNGVDSGLPARTGFYVAQSWLSFARWNTTDGQGNELLYGPSLFGVGLEMLERGPQEYQCLNDVSQVALEGLLHHAKKVRAESKGPLTKEEDSPDKRSGVPKPDGPMVG